MLVVLESTTYPGTTEELLKPILENASGLKCGKDFYLAFSPERVDPGNLIYKTKNTPKVVGGCTPECFDEVDDLSIEDFLDSLTPEQQRKATIHLNLLWAQREGAKINGNT